MVPPIIGVSQNIENIKNAINQIAKTEENILILGEKGVGKDLVVQNLYHRSKRVGKPCVKINCALLAGTSLESEIFGCKPIITDDIHAKNQGLFERIRGGVLFLDKIDMISPVVQTKLLQWLEGGNCLKSSGSEKPSKTDVWIIAATTRDLKEYATTGKFRRELYCCLATNEILIEPLRRRREDIPYLIHHYMRQYSNNLNVERIKELKKKSIRRMVKYQWPGNVRELQSVIKRIVIFGDNEAACQYRMPGLDDDIIPATDELAIIDMSPSLSMS